MGEFGIWVEDGGWEGDGPGRMRRGGLDGKDGNGQGDGDASLGKCLRSWDGERDGVLGSCIRYLQHTVYACVVPDSWRGRCNHRSAVIWFCVGTTGRYCAIQFWRFSPS
jgi:hypothetical protein